VRACVCGWVPGELACKCVSARIVLLIHHARRISHIVLPVAAPLAPPHVSPLSHKQQAKDKHVHITDKFMLPCSCTKLTDIPLFTSHVVTCRAEIFAPEVSSCCAVSVEFNFISTRIEIYRENIFVSFLYQ
jgi:hypothetical protein